jgi:hypothetical protein
VAVEGLLADPEVFGHPRDVAIFGQQHVALSELESSVRVCAFVVARYESHRV